MNCERNVEIKLLFFCQSVFYHKLSQYAILSFTFFQIFYACAAAQIFRQFHFPDFSKFLPYFFDSVHFRQNSCSPAKKCRKARKSALQNVDKVDKSVYNFKNAKKREVIHVDNFSFFHSFPEQVRREKRGFLTLFLQINLVFLPVFHLSSNFFKLRQKNFFRN